MASRSTTKNGLVWLGGEPEPARAATRRRRQWLPLTRMLSALVLLLGLLTFPVSCALASGPHSLFVDAASISPAADPHAHHRVADDVAAQPAPSPDSAQIDDLPSPFSVLSMMVAVIPGDAVGELPRPATNLTAFHAPIADWLTPLEPPPPR
ncbi:MAG: hypothetical protein IT336_02970 [Thermomicrobiales bacterium]|nr:hypothetical protein [Thermomicrobiales bacterium]